MHMHNFFNKQYNLTKSGTLVFVKELSSMFFDLHTIYKLYLAKCLTSHTTSLMMIFTYEDRIVTNFLCQNKRYGARR